jgi:hypothetical protein
VLNPTQRSSLLKKFCGYLKNDGRILFDVSSFAQYDTKLEFGNYEYSGKDGFWSPDPYYVFHNSFKYEKERLLLDKFTIVEETRVRENYNWLQCYSIETISKELQENGFEVVDYFANVAGDAHKENATEIAIIAKPKIVE